MQTGSSDFYWLEICGKTAYVPLLDRMEGAWLWTHNYNRHLSFSVLLTAPVWIVWTDILFKRLENKRGQRVFLRDHYVHTVVYKKNYRGYQPAGNKMFFLGPPTLPQINKAGIFKKSMEARNWGGIGLSYRPARLHRLAEFITWN
jgi:hypothetical protein